MVVIASPVAGGKIVWSDFLSSLLEAAPWGARRTYFIALHAAREPARPWTLALHVQLPVGIKVTGLCGSTR